MAISWSVATGRIADALPLMCLMLVHFPHPTQLDRLCFINHPEIAVWKIIIPLAGAVSNADSHFFIPCFLQVKSRVLVSIVHTL